MSQTIKFKSPEQVLGEVREVLATMPSDHPHREDLLAIARSLRDNMGPLTKAYNEVKAHAEAAEVYMSEPKVRISERAKAKTETDNLMAKLRTRAP
jgi:hypothetical protein